MTGNKEKQNKRRSSQRQTSVYKVKLSKSQWPHCTSHTSLLSVSLHYKLPSCSLAWMHTIFQCRINTMQTDRYNKQFKIDALMEPAGCSSRSNESSVFWYRIGYLSNSLCWQLNEAEFNLSETRNLSTAGCSCHVWAVIHMWSLTSIYGGNKRGVNMRGTHSFLFYSFFFIQMVWSPRLSDVTYTCLTDTPSHPQLSPPSASPSIESLYRDLASWLLQITRLWVGGQRKYRPKTLWDEKADSLLWITC